MRQYYSPSSKELDITDPDKVSKVLGAYNPDVILHAAAYTDTLKPDDDASEAVKCYQVNVLGTRNLVQHATCPIIYVSTESALEPYNFYILTKLQGELEVMQHKPGYTILRTSFRDDPFEYPKAAVDMLTLADSVTNITPLIDSYVDEPPTNDIQYVGTGVKTVYELAKMTRPDVIAMPRKLIYSRLPAMEGLRSV